MAPVGQQRHRGKKIHSNQIVDCEIIPQIKRAKFSRYRPGVAQRVGRGIALVFHDRGTRRG